MKKGFTLIELVLVIVLLSILTLISIPVVNGLINQTKRAAAVRSMEGYVKELQYAQAQYQERNDGKYATDIEKLSIKYSGKEIEDVAVIFKNGFVDKVVATILGYTCSYINHEIECDMLEQKPKHTELEYIITDGKEYIDTGINPTVNTKIVFTHIPLEKTNSSWTAFFGYREGSKDINSFYFSSGGGYISVWVGSVHIIYDHYNHIVGKPEIITISKDEFLLQADGVTKFDIHNTAEVSIVNPDNIYVFARSIGPNKPYYLSKIKFISMQIYESDKLVMDLIPVKKDDGVVCIYDKVNKTYHEFIGKGTVSVPPKAK